jgi:transposase InsO family protein
MVRALRACAHKVGPKRIARLMREEGLRGVRKRGFKPNTTNSRHSREVAPNLLDRQFAVAADTAALASDITYLPTREGWLYLAVILSLRTRQVVGYSLADRMPDNLVQQALLNAYATNPAEPGTLFHSDRGSQYASNDFRNTLKPLGFVPSMSRKGNCWDNAVAESFFATLKAEEATGVYETKVAAHHGIASYIHGFYNPIRLHSSLDYLSPNDYARKLNSAALRRAS